MIRHVIGRTIAHYRIVEKIGEGGMGVVYAADDLRLRRRVALKAVKQEVAADPARRARLEREAQAAAGLSHENIAAVHAFEVDSDGTCAIVLEYVPGPNLRQVAAGRKLRKPSAVKISAARTAVRRSAAVRRWLRCRSSSRCRGWLRGFMLRV